MSMISPLAKKFGIAKSSDLEEDEIQTRDKTEQFAGDHPHYGSRKVEYLPGFVLGRFNRYFVTWIDTSQGIAPRLVPSTWFKAQLPSPADLVTVELELEVGGKTRVFGKVSPSDAFPRESRWSLLEGFSESVDAVDFLHRDIWEVLGAKRTISPKLEEVLIQILDEERDPLLSRENYLRTAVDVARAGGGERIAEEVPIEHGCIDKVTDTHYYVTLQSKDGLAKYCIKKSHARGGPLKAGDFVEGHVVELERGGYEPRLRKYTGEKIDLDSLQKKIDKLASETFEQEMAQLKSQLPSKGE